MEDPTMPFADPTAPFTPTAPAPAVNVQYTDPISSFFGGIFFIVILVLVIILVVILLIARAAGLSGTTSAPAAPVKKEKFEMGPPYPSCKTDGALAMF